jgi:WD40 repeat protein
MTHEKPVLSAAFNPDGRHLATVSLDGTARVWDMNGGRDLAHCARRTA